MVVWSQIGQTFQHRHKQQIPAAVHLLAAILILWRHKLSRSGSTHSNSTSPAPRTDQTRDVDYADKYMYEQNGNGIRSLLIPYRGSVKKVPIRPISQSTFQANTAHFPRIVHADLSSSSKRKAVDKQALRQLLAILRICFPKWNAREVWMLALHSFFLVLRTVLSLIVAWLDGKIVKDLVTANAPGFLRGLGLWFALAVPSTFTNSMIRFLQQSLSLRLRTRLTGYTHDLYISQSPYIRYYRSNILYGFEGADQYITSDIAAFTEALSLLYGNILKPSLDILLFTSQLSSALGFRGTLLMMVNYYLTAKLLRACTPDFGRLASVESKLEGEWRAGVARVGREAEEIAFYGGGYREKEILWRAYLRLIKHVNSIYKIRIGHEWIEDFVIKYLWSAAGYGLIAVPIFFTRNKRKSSTKSAAMANMDESTTVVANRAESYISSRRLLLSLADAGGRLMYAYKDILELAGLTSRIYHLLSTLHNIPPADHFTETADVVELQNVDIILQDTFESDETELEKQTDVEVLVKGLDLTVRPGEHLMITGPNGVGKTTIARVIKGLWNSRGGTIKRPSDKSTWHDSIFFVPQRAYHVQGTLLDQIIYPLSYAEHAPRHSEIELMTILKAVHLEYLPKREGGWFVRKEWKDVLSGGEKQRMALARVFYHKPRFAVLDECTSAVSSDVEGLMYQHAKDDGITLITISLRPSLSKYHTQVLVLSGEASGKWELRKVGSSEEQMELDREITALQNRLSEVDGWKARLSELDELLRTPAPQP